MNRRTRLVSSVLAVIAISAAVTATAALDAAAAPTPKTISVSPASVSEAAGSVTVTLQRTDASRSTSILLETSDGTATAPGDYTAVATRVEFPVGDYTATQDIPIVNDTAVESDETFTVTLSRPRQGFKLDTTASSATVTITNDDGTELLVNGDFENPVFTTPGWTVRRPLGGSAPQPVYVTNPYRSESHSIRLGGPGATGKVDSQIQQQVVVPSTGTTTLTWYSMLTLTDYSGGVDYADWADVMIYNSDQSSFINPWHCCTVSTQETEWQYHSYTLPASYNGQTIWLVLGVRQDGASDVSTMYVDDVSMSQA